MVLRPQSSGQAILGTRDWGAVGRRMWSRKQETGHVGRHTLLSRIEAHTLSLIEEVDRVKRKDQYKEVVANHVLGHFFSLE